MGLSIYIYANNCSGYQSNRTGPDTAEDQMWATNGLVIYGHSTNTVQNISDPQDYYGYTHAVMHHLGPFDNSKGKHKGLLLSLPGKYYNLSDNFIENDRFGESVREKLEYCPLMKSLNLISVFSMISLKLNSMTLRRVNGIPNKQVISKTNGQYHGRGFVLY